MSITATRLDGQTVGLNVAAPSTAVDFLELDMATGTVTSSYLTAADISNLKATVDGIFAIVPYASRAAGALNILTKLASGAAVDATTLTPSAAALGGDLYALRLTPSAVPADLIVGLPYSATGLSAFAMSGSVTGGGGGAVNSVTASAPIASSGGANPNISHNASGVVAAAYANPSSVTVDVTGHVTAITAGSAPVTSVSGAAPISSSGGATPTISHDNSGVVAGAYTNASITVDAKGHVTVAASGTAPVTAVTATAPITSTGGATPDIGLAASGVAPGAYTNANITVDSYGRITVAANGSAGGLVNWTEAQTAFGGKTIDSFTALGAPNADAALVANGNGATLAQIPDGGGNGNVRGIRATDFQKDRSIATAVASGGWSVICGGYNNFATGNYSSVIGGSGNSAASQYATAAGGNSNYAIGYASTVSGGEGNQMGSVGTPTAGTIAGGYNNRIELGISNDYSTISGGRDSAINNSADAVISGGRGNLISSGTGATIMGGEGHLATGFYSSVLGGFSATTRESRGRMVFASGSPEVSPTTNRGAAQWSMVVPFKDTTDASTQDLTTTGTAIVGGSNFNILRLKPYSVYKVRAEVAARNKNTAIAADIKGWTIEGLAYMDAAAASAAITSVTSATFGAGLAGATATLVADNVVGGVYVQVQGLVGTNIRWAASITATEVVTF